MTDKVQLIKQEIERLINDKTDGKHVAKADITAPKRVAYLDILNIIDSLPEESVSEDKSEKELAETYLEVFEKKYPILPTLKGKQKADFKNFLNKCQQEFGLKEFGIHPTQSKLFEKLTLLWAVWGAEHLEGLGKSNQDEFAKEPVSEDLEEEYEKYFKTHETDIVLNPYTNCRDIARHFAEWQRQRDFPTKDITDSAMYWCGYKDCKEEMMEDAVEGVIDIRKWPAKAQVEFYDRLPDFDVRTGNKVKIIIVKPEQQ